MEYKPKQLDMKPFPGISRKISIRLPHALAHTRIDPSHKKKGKWPIENSGRVYPVDIHPLSWYNIPHKHKRAVKQVCRPAHDNRKVSP